MKQILILLFLYAGVVTAQTQDSVLFKLNKQIEIDSTNSTLLLQRASYHYDHYNFEKALSDITLCKIYSTEDPFVYYLSSLIQNDIGNYSSSLKDIDKAIALDPSPAFFQARAMTNLSLENYEEAIKDSYKFKDIKELQMSFFIVQVIAKQKQNKLDESILIGKEALEHFPEFSEMYNLLAKSYNLKENNEAALEAIDKAIEISPDVEFYYQTKTNLLIKQKVNYENTTEESDGKLRFKELSFENLKDLDKLVKKRRKKYHFGSLRKKFKKDYQSLTLDEYYMLYYGFSSQKRYSPYFGSIGEEINILRDELYKGNFEQVIHDAELILEKDLSQLEVYLILARAYLYKGDQEKAFEGYYKYTAFLEGIVATGDGKSFKTPFIIINIRDEYIVMNYLNIQPLGQSLSNYEDHSYDVHNYISNEEEHDIYFLIDKPFSSFGKIF